jgi:fructose-1,6-bisphosphatase/sedoheptulose 1,7-bisphosphatase-like protein
MPGIRKDHWPERLQMEVYANADDLFFAATNVGVSDFVLQAVKRYRDAVQRHTWIVFEMYKDQSDYEDLSDYFEDDE